MAEFARLPNVAMLALRRRDGEGLPKVGLSSWQGDDRVIAIGPDEWLVVAPDGDASALSARFVEQGGVQVDVSGNRVRYRVAGPDALALLAAGCALDLEALRVDDAISTLLARAQVVIVREAEEAWLVLPRRSFARYLEDWAVAAER